jgi:chromosome partitioning protein
MRDCQITQIYWIPDMTAKIFTVAQQKGGAGKTTLAAHLAIAFLEQGLRVAVVDIDPQESLLNWFKQRAQLDGELGPNVRAAQGWRVESEVRSLARDHDVIIIDSPPHAETEAKIAMRSADLVIVPLQPSPMDLWATGKTIEQVAGQGSRGLLVLNRVPARAKIAEEMTKATRTMGAELAHALRRRDAGRQGCHRGGLVEQSRGRDPGAGTRDPGRGGASRRGLESRAGGVLVRPCRGRRSGGSRIPACRSPACPRRR